MATGQAKGAYMVSQSPKGTSSHETLCHVPVLETLVLGGGQVMARTHWRMGGHTQASEAESVLQGPRVEAFLLTEERKQISNQRVS